MSAILVRLFVLIAVFVSIFLLTQLLLGMLARRRAETEAVNKRLTLLRSGLSVDAVRGILRKDAPDRLAENAGVLARMWFGFQRKVRMAAIPLEPRLVALIALIAFIAIVAIILFLAWSAQFKLTIGVIHLIILIGATSAFGLPYLIISHLADKRYKRMEAQFPIALDVFVRALRAGHPVASAIDLLTREMEDPLGSEFGLVSDEVAYGANLTDALMGLAERWGLEDIRMFVISLSLQSETGGNLAEILANLSAVIRERASLFMKVRALSSEGRMTGWMLSVLPVFTLLSMFAVNPSFYLQVATDPIFIYGSTGLVVLYFIGVFMIRRMIDLKV